MPDPVDMGARRWIVVVLGGVLALIGFVGVFVALELPTVSVVGVDATVVDSVQPSCDNPIPVKVRFEWEQSNSVQYIYDEPCGRAYGVGAYVRVFAASNDASNIAATADAILHPDESDPLVPFGPNGARPYMILLGGLTALAGVALTVAAVVTNRPRSTST